MSGKDLFKDSYKKYRPLGRGGPKRFPQADDPVNPALVSSRRPHIEAFLSYMAPAVNQHEKWWRLATDHVAAAYQKQGLASVPTETFDYMVDKEAFTIFFRAVKSYSKLYVEPDWPWTTSDLPAADDGAPKRSKAYDDYLRDKKTKETEASQTSGQDPVESVDKGEEIAIPSLVVSSDNIEPKEVLNDSVLQADKPIFNVETLRGEMNRERNLRESVETVWKQYRGENAITWPIVAPFALKLETFIPDGVVHRDHLEMIN
ncbi:hypothetical protein ACHAP5_011883 [Fusarium lateritium]